MTRSRKALSNLIVVLALTLLSATFFLHAVGNSDIFWQLKSGEWTFHHGFPLSQDVFSYTVNGQAWIDSEWLAGLLFFSVEKLAGFFGLSIFSFLIGFLICAFVFIISRRSSEVDLSILLSALVMLSGAQRFGVLRPELFGYLLFTAFIFMLSSGENFKKKLISIFLLQIIWTNLHGSFLLGPLLALLFCVNFRKDIFIFLATAVATLINPYGLKIFYFPLSQIFQKSVLSISSDWAGPLYGGELLTGFIVLALMVFGVIWFSVKNKKVFDWRFFLLSIGFFLLSLKHARFIPFSAIGCALYLSKSMPPQLFSVGTFAAAMATVCIFAGSFLLGGPPVSFISNFGGLLIGTNRPVGVGIDLEPFPVSALNIIRENSKRGKIFNDMAFGGFITYNLWPDVPVFIDTRTVLYGDEFVKAYSDALFDKNAFDTLAKKWGIKTVVYDAAQIKAPNGPLKFLKSDPDWKLIYSVSNCDVFSKIK